MRILQFGTGRFLRAFIDPIVPEPRSITVVQSRTNSSGADCINRNPKGYHVWTRGIQNGATIDSVEFVESLRGALVANTQWQELQALAQDAELKLIVSNTTAAGLQSDASDDGVSFRTQCPVSFPAKVAALLLLRFEKGLPGVTVLPLELVEMNADRLLELVTEQAQRWALSNGTAFIDWLKSENRWLNNLVDRIVVGVTDTPPWEQHDELAVMGEPFRMLAIQDDGKGQSPLPEHEMIQWTHDLAPFFLRKVRILNGLHTAMVAKFLPLGKQTVLDCVSDPESREWVIQLLNDEILPALKSRGLDEEAFAREVIERFENPFFEHRLADIANGHDSKLSVRIQPTVDDYQQAFGKAPARLSEVLATKLERV